MTDSCGGNERKHAVHHAETGSEDRNEGKLLTGEHLSLGDRDGSLYLGVFKRKISGCFVADKGCYLADKRSEFL